MRKQDMEAKKKDILSTIFFLLFAIYISIESYCLDLGKWRKPGPGYYPFIASIILGMISLYILVNTLLKSSRGKVEPQASFEPLSWQNITLTLLGMLAYVFLLHWMGFVLCTFLLMLFFIWVVGGMRWFPSLIASLAITLGAYLLFEVLLNAQFPRGFFIF